MKAKLTVFVVLSTMAMLAMAAGTASATTLELGGTTKNETLTITASLEQETSLVLSRTDGSLANTCTEGDTHGYTTVFTGQFVHGVWTSKSLSNCTRPVTVHEPGGFTIEHEPNTTNAIIFSSGGQTTFGSPFGTLSCKTGEGVRVGTITGTALGFATWHINAVMNCGFLVPSAKLQGSYWITSPNSLGISK